MFSDNDRHKKSPQSLCHAGFLYFTGSIRIMIWCWRPCVLFYTYMIFMVIFVQLLIKGSLKGPKKGVITDFTYSRAKILDTARLGVELTKHSLSSPEAISRMQNLTSN